MSYIYAASETLLSLIYNTGGEIDSDFFEGYITNISNKFLITYGTGLSKSTKTNYNKLKTPNNYNNSLIKTVFGKPFMIKSFDYLQKNKLQLFMDSGGFQATMGYLGKQELNLFIREYANFISNYNQFFSYFFTLDLLFITGSMANKKDLLNINHTSFTMLANLPDEIKKKLIFIYHFRTPTIYSIWKEISKTYEKQFSNYYSMGGIVAFSGSAKTTPIHLYIIPLCQIIKNALEQKQDNIKIHILGGASYKDVFFYKVISKIIEYYHKIKVEITYDSSAPFKQFQQARICDILIPDTFIIQTLSVKENDLNKIALPKLNIDKTIEQYLFSRYNAMLSNMDKNGKYNSILNNRKFYQFNTDKNQSVLNKEIALIGMLNIANQYKLVEEMSDKYLNEIFYLFENGREEEFFDLIYNKMILLNRMKISRKLRTQYKLKKSMQVLKDLDIDYIDHVVNTYLSSEEMIKGNNQVDGFDFL